MSSVFLAFVFSTVIAFVSGNCSMPKDLVNSSFFTTCKCDGTDLSNGNLGYSFSCRINEIAELKRIRFPPNTHSLSLSHNSLKTVKKDDFQQFQNLRKLYLDHNMIEDIQDGAFENLDSLHHLDLSYNKLHKWNTSLLKDLPSLRLLNVLKNDGLTIHQDQINTNCTTLIGLNISPTLKNCNLTRLTNITREILEKKLTGKFKRQCIYFPDDQLDKLESVRKTFVAYEGVCEGNKQLNIDVSSISSLKKLLTDRCYRAARRLRWIVFALGSLAVVLNIIVVSAILIIPRLQQMVPFLLIAHLSFCDLLIGVYALGTASGHEVSPDYQEIKTYRESMSNCGVFWVIFLMGQSLGVLTCLLVTIERYLATVYCMKPVLKLERETSLMILPFFWVIALIIAIPLQIIDYQKITLNFMCILLRDYTPSKGFFVGQGLMIAFLAIYVVEVFLYFRIYVYVRDSSRRVNVHREAKLAKRIGVIVMTNFVCFALPNLSMLFFTTLELYTPLDDIPNTILRRWLPPMCLVVNACVNPCFFAYGNVRFSASLRQSIRAFVVKYLNIGAWLAKHPRVFPDLEIKSSQM